MRKRPDPEGPASSRSLLILSGLVLLHVAVRVLSRHFHYFWETDDPPIAAGVAALLTDGIGPAYRYAPQAGYYRLVEAIASLTGTGVAGIPGAMVWISVVASAAVPLFGLGLFPGETSRRERFAWAFLLAVNPILYWSGRYGNTAMPSIALVAACFFLLSRARTLRGECAGLACFVLAVFVRADAVLAGPAVALWLWFRHASLPAVAARLAGLGLALVALYAGLFLFDPRISRMVGEVASHVGSVAFVSRFYDYLVLAFSPVPLFLAIWGMRGMLDARPRLLAVFAAWCLPFAAFYYLTLTTPRYFLPLVVPLTGCAALALVELVDRCARFVPRWLAAGALAGLASVHMLVPVDLLIPSASRAIFERSNEMTHDGPMHTGGFLYHALFRGGFLFWSWHAQEFGSDAQFATDTRRALADLARAPAGHLFVGVRGFPDCAFSYELYRSGARVTEVLPAGSGPAEQSHIGPTRWQLGAVEILTSDPQVSGFSSLPVLPLQAGDRVWLSRADDEALVTSKLAPGLTLDGEDGSGAPFWTRRVVARTRGEAL